jgi:hypothetical protein
MIWEAFVSNKAKNRDAENPHIDDARLAVMEFQRRAATGAMWSDVDEAAVLNLAAAGLIAAGLSSDIGLLRMPCVVVKPPDQFVNIRSG